MVLAREAGAGEKCLDTAGPAAIAGSAGRLVLARPGQRVVAPFAGDAVAAADERPADDESAADAGTKNDAEDNAGISRGAVDRFGERKAIGVVLEPHRAAKAR